MHDTTPTPSWWETPIEATISERLQSDETIWVAAWTWPNAREGRIVTAYDHGHVIGHTRDECEQNARTVIATWRQQQADYTAKVERLAAPTTITI